MSFFDGLYILEIGNNHLGSVDLGKKLIDEIAEAVKCSSLLDFAIKFQYRPQSLFAERYHTPLTDKMKARGLDAASLHYLNQYAKEAGFITGCTAFSAESLAHIGEIPFDFYKVQAADSEDWKLLAKLEALRKPISISLPAIRSFEHENALLEALTETQVDLCLNHCVSEYPTPVSFANLSRIANLRERAPNCVIGYSSHLHRLKAPISHAIAYALGARCFERHIEPTDFSDPKSYNLTPANLIDWILAAETTERLMKWGTATPEERAILKSYTRSAYASRDLKAGELFEADYCLPNVEGGVSYDSVDLIFRVNQDVKRGEPILWSMKSK